MKNINRYIICSFIFAFFLFTPFFSAKAATIGFNPASGSYKVGDTINVKVYVNTESKSINAISANIKYSSDILTLSSISKVGSIINLWAQDPSFSNTTGIASFEGVVLNGYTSNSANVITLIFKAKSSGTASLSFSTGSVLANDGNGTEVLSSKGKSTLTISKVEVTPVEKINIPATTPKEQLPVKTPEKDTTIVISEIKNNTSNYSPNKFLITSPQPVSDKSYSIQIDSAPATIWTDDGTHIYQAPELTNGMHVIKVMAVDTSSSALSGFLNFSTIVLKIPTITYYPTDLYVDQFMVLKGIADPTVDVELTITNTTTGGVTVDHVTTNSDGMFTYVPDNKMQVGNYSIIARSQSAKGIFSNYMEPIQIINKEHQLNSFISKFSNYFTILIPLIAVAFLLIVILLYGLYNIKAFHRYLKKKLIGTESVISKSFNILDEDAEEEIAIFQKIRKGKSLNKDEQVFLDKFKEDIIEAEKIIQKELKDIEKTNNI